jgi:hypothetical protein
MMILETDEYQDTVEHLAEWIESQGLRSPAILFLEIARPLALIGSQVLYLFQPLLRFAEPFWSNLDGSAIVDQYAQLLEDPDSIDRILARLDRSNTPDAGKTVRQVKGQGPQDGTRQQ